MSHTHVGSASARNRPRLRATLALTSAFLVAEALAGWLTGSLALLADAGHMLTDVAGLGLALFAIHMAERPATAEHTYGFYRAEILAALANAVVLLAISGWVIVEAYARFRSPEPIASGPMLVVACVGLLVNVAGVWLLRSSSTESLNLKGAYFEVLSDAISSVGVIAAAAVMWFTGWVYADAIVSAGIGLFIVPRTIRLIWDAVGVLLEGTPSDVNIGALREALSSIEDVRDVHDLHVWSLTSGVNALSVHVVIEADVRLAEMLTRVTQCVANRFDIHHVTVQIEPVSWHCGEAHA